MKGSEKMNIEEKLYGYLPRFIDVECDDREVEEVED